MKQAVVPLKGEAGEAFSAYDVATDVVNLRYIFTQTLWRWSSLATDNEHLSKDDSQSWIVFQSYHSLCMWRHCPKCMNKHWNVVELPRIGIERFPIESCLYREEVQKRSFPRKGNQAQTATPSNTRSLQRLMAYFRQPQSQAESEAGMIDSKER